MCEWNKIRTKDRIRICARRRGIIVQIRVHIFMLPMMPENLERGPNKYGKHVFHNVDGGASWEKVVVKGYHWAWTAPT